MFLDRMYTNNLNLLINPLNWANGAKKVTKRAKTGSAVSAD